MTIKKHISILLIFIAIAVHAQQQNIRFDHITSDNGLSQNTITGIVQDHQGYMWFGTSSLGVCRYDGANLSWHYEEQLQTTPNGGDFGTRAIFEDKNGKFWINNTRFRYVVETYGNKPITIKKENGIGYLNKTNKMEFPFFLSVTEDNKGNLWMATYEDGVYKYNGKELIHYPIKEGETDVLLFTIYKDNKGVLWLGTHNAGVYKFTGKTFKRQF